MKRWWAQRPDQISAFEHHLQLVKWGRIVQNGLPRTGGKPIRRLLEEQFLLDENCAGPAVFPQKRCLSSARGTYQGLSPPVGYVQNLGTRGDQRQVSKKR